VRTCLLKFTPGERRRQGCSHSDCRPASTLMPGCRSVSQWAGSGQFAVSRWPMSFTRIDGASLTGICGDQEHPASFPKRLAAQFGQPPLSVVFDPEGRTGCKSLPIAKFASSL
jgi:hypothetical protein